MKYYQLNSNEVLEKLKSSEDGLTELEAEKRKNKYGKNILVEGKKESRLEKFFSQFKDIMILVLFISAVISFIISYINKESYVDSIAIIAIVFINAILGFVQEIKADKALESLKNLQSKTTKVKRDGNIIVVNTEDVVKGDILLLEAGDTVPADARIIYASAFKCDESSLTGESFALLKNDVALKGEVPLAERTNMIYSGTNVVYGKCTAVVTDIGMDTEFGKIAKSLSETKKEITPLEKKINGISKFLSLIIVIIILVMFLIGIIRGMNITTVIMLSISLAVAAIPEGLPAVITITLSLGVSSMAKKRAIVRKLSSVETLGCTEVICSDKTGTITQNKMTVVKIYFDNKIQYVSEELDSKMLEIMALNNDSTKYKKEFVGDPTEIALYELCELKKHKVKDIRDRYPRIAEIPFDSERKMMSTIHISTEGLKLYTKGSFDSIIECCSMIYENGKVEKLTDKRKKELKNIEKELSSKAYRILAYSYKDIENDYKLDSSLEKNLIFLGLSCMIDPPREDVKEAIKSCISAHIKPVMITGDSLDTAKAIAKDIGILKKDSEALTGSDLDKMTQQELNKNIANYSVYARVSPMNKVAIVKAWQSNGKIVAMTGDGVNDAPAIKEADIGVGMGITGTEVSKSVSNIVLADDSFSTIVTAVKEGRRIFDNIRNVLVYLLTGNIAEILIVFIGMLFGKEIFLPVQLLYINLITDSIPAIALAFEKETDDVMKRDVRKNESSFFTQFLITKIAFAAILKSITILSIYFISNYIWGINIATTMTFLTLIVIEMLFALSCKNLKKSILNKQLFNNSYMNKSLIGIIILQLIVFLTPIKRIFNIVNISFYQVIICILISILVFIIDELFKSTMSKKFKD